MKNTNEEHFLREAIASGYECQLLQKWANLVNKFDELARDAEPLEDDENDVDWTKVAQGLQWKPPNGRREEDALVTLIARDIPRQEARYEESQRTATPSMSSQS